MLCLLLLRRVLLGLLLLGLLLLRLLLRACSPWRRGGAPTNRWDSRGASRAKSWPPVDPDPASAAGLGRLRPLAAARAAITPHWPGALALAPAPRRAAHALRRHSYERWESQCASDRLLTHRCRIHSLS